MPGRRLDQSLGCQIGSHPAFLVVYDSMAAKPGTRGSVVSEFPPSEGLLICIIKFLSLIDSVGWVRKWLNNGEIQSPSPK